MNPLNPTTKCQRTVNAARCGAPRSAHGPGGECPRGTGTYRSSGVQSPHRASSSFTRAELEALVFALDGLRAGKDLRVFARTASPALAGVAHKVATMLASIDLRARWGPEAHRRRLAPAEAVTGVREREERGAAE